MILLQDIPHFSEWTKVEKIEKGHSSDQKFFVQTKAGKHLLLRLSDFSDFEKKRSEFELMKFIFAQNIIMSEPLEFGTCGAGKFVYGLFSWIEGKSVDTILSALTEEKKYELGISAGQILQKIHHNPAPSATDDWRIRWESKYLSRLALYKKAASKLRMNTLLLILLLHI